MAGAFAVLFAAGLTQMSLSGQVIGGTTNPGIIVDDADASFFSIGLQRASYPGALRTGMSYALTGNPATIAYWKFQTIQPGDYDVLATWPAFKESNPSASFAVYGWSATTAPEAIGGFIMDETKTPAGDRMADALWQKGTQIRVKMPMNIVVAMSGNTNKLIIADAVMLRPVKPVLSSSSSSSKYIVSSAPSSAYSSYVVSSRPSESSIPTSSMRSSTPSSVAASAQSSMITLQPTKIASIVNANPDADNTNVPTGVSPFGQFKFIASSTGSGAATLSGIIFNVNATNVLVDATAFKIYNKSDQTGTVNCRVYSYTGQLMTGTASGSFLVHCTNLATSIVDTRIFPGGNTTLVLRTNVLNTKISNVASSSLQAYISNFNNPDAVWFGNNWSHISWFNMFGKKLYIDYFVGDIRSTLYKS
jgi:hypothetical protein